MAPSDRPIILASFLQPPTLSDQPDDHRVFALLILGCTWRFATVPPPNRSAFFPIMAWDNVPNDPAVLEKMHDCGLTVAGFVPPAALDACQAAGLKAIVSDPRVGGYDWQKVDPKVRAKQVSELIERSTAIIQPSSATICATSRPRASFPVLAAVSSVVKELHPGVWPYINLFPNYADASQLGTKTYDEYLEKFIEVCKPPVLSYDHYAFFEGGGMRGEYFANLESIRRAAVKHKLPFWQIVLSVGCLNYREPSMTDMRFQVYTSLAYGARGLAYFKYFTPRSAIIATVRSISSATKLRCGTSCGKSICKLASWLRRC